MIISALAAGTAIGEANKVIAPARSRLRITHGAIFLTCHIV